MGLLIELVAVVITQDAFRDGLRHKENQNELKEGHSNVTKAQRLPLASRSECVVIMGIHLTVAGPWRRRQGKKKEEH